MTNTLYVDVSVAEINNRIDIDVSSVEELNITVSEGGSGGGDRLPDYIGDYTVVPKVDQVVLPTKNKSMLDDVTVFQIPYKEVPNEGGGMTVTIGLE